jgi:hypothetical protein
MWLAMGEYEQAEAHFSVVIILIAERTWEQIDALMQARLGMAEVNLERGNLAQAWENIEEAYRLASGKRNTLSLVEINLTRAHIAAADPNTPESAAAYHALSRRELAGHHSPIVLARSLMQEARYQQRHGNLDAAYQLAQEAYEIFAQQGALEEMQLAETLIQP